MATTLNSIIYDINEIASSGGNPNEFKIPLEQIKYWVHQTRAMMISQALDKRYEIQDNWIQLIGCVELEQTDISDCCVVPSGCFGLRSVRQLPTTIETDENNLVLSVTTIDDTPLSETNVFRSRYSNYNKYTKNRASWFMRNNYLYVINNDLLSLVNVYGIYDDPSELGAFKNCADDSCWSADSPYPVNLKMASAITDYIIKTKVAPFMTFDMNNANDSNGATSRQKLEDKQAE